MESNSSQSRGSVETAGLIPLYMPATPQAQKETWSKPPRFFYALIGIK